MAKPKHTRAKKASDPMALMNLERLRGKELLGRVRQHRAGTAALSLRS